MAPRAEGIGEALRFRKARIEGLEESQVPMWAPLRVRIEAEVRERLQDVSLGFSVFSPDGVHLFTCETGDGNMALALNAGKIGESRSASSSTRISPRATTS